MVALSLPGTARADTRAGIPGRSAYLVRKVAPADRVAKRVARADTRADGLAAHVPRTGLDKITGAEARLFRTLQYIANGRHLRGTETAVYLVDADTGEEIYAVREDAPVNPASNVKLLSTAAALATLGPEWRYRTRLFGPTPLMGVAEGDLYLRGNFDPTLGAADLESLAWQLADRGITRVDGDILVGHDPERDAVARPKIQIRVHSPAADADPVIEVLPANDAVVTVMQAKTITRGRSRLALATETITDEAGRSRLQLTVSGTLRAGASRTYWRWMRDRGQYTGHVLRRALIDAGVDVTGTVREVSFADYVRLAGPSFLPVELATHRSEPLSALVAIINKYSRNRVADRVLMTAAAATYGGEPTMDKGVRLMKSWLAEHTGIAGDDVVLDTGSGLSYNTKFSARNVVEVLREASGLRAQQDDGDGDGDDWAQAFQDSLSVAGVDGTLRNRFKRTGVQTRFLGKTGTLLRVIALAGILRTDSGRAVAVAIVTNNHRSGRKRSVKVAHERMVHAIYGYLKR